MDAEQLKGVACWWLKHGVPVVPMNGKQPLAEWGEWLKRPQTEEEFAQLPWEKSTGFAVLCGSKTPNGYLGVIDLDIKNQSPEAIELGKKIIEQLPETRVDRTPSGGKHLIYFSEKPVRCESKYLSKCGLEILGEGKLCITSPSRGYEILEHSGYAVVDNLNALVYKLLHEAGVIQPEQGIETEQELLLETWLEQIKTNLNIEKEDDVRVYVHCPFHLPDEHPSLIIVKGKFYAVDYHDGRVYTLKQLAQALGIQLGTPSVAGSSQRAVPAVGVPKTKALPEPHLFQPKPLLELIENAPDREWLVQDLIPRRALILLAGKGGVGKSFLSLTLAADVSSKKPVFNFFSNHGSKVLYIDEENDLTTQKERVKLLGASRFGEVDMVDMQGFKLDEEDCIMWLDEYLKSNPHDLVILDCWTDLIAGIEENDAVEVNNVLQDLKRIAWERNTTILLIHHLRKNTAYVTEEKDELRGSSVLLNKPDIVLLLEQDPMDPVRRVLKLLKNRLGQPRAFSIFFECSGDELGIRCQGENQVVENEVEKCVKVIMDLLENIGPGTYETKRLKLAASGFATRTIYRALEILQARGILEKARRGFYGYKGPQSKLMPQSDDSAKVPTIYNNGKLAQTETSSNPVLKPLNRPPSSGPGDPAKGVGSNSEQHGPPKDKAPEENCRSQDSIGMRQPEPNASEKVETRLLCQKCVNVYREQGFLEHSEDLRKDGVCESCGKTRPLFRAVLRIPQPEPEASKKTEPTPETLARLRDLKGCNEASPFYQASKCFVCGVEKEGLWRQLQNSSGLYQVCDTCYNLWKKHYGGA